MACRSMSRTASSVGMMDGAYFVSRTDLLQWVNDLLQIDLKKIEMCASGTVYCQIVDACNPGTVAMRKLNWKANKDFEFIPNFKVLQAAFDKNGIDKHIDVDKLIRGKYQDNLEFLQWMKCYWEREGMGRSDYDPVAARADRPLPPWARPLLDGLSASARPRPAQKENAGANIRPASADVIKKAAPAASERPARAKRAGQAAAQPTALTSARDVRPLDREEELPAALTSARDVRPSDREEELQARCVEQEHQLNDLHDTLDGLERERDYYFKKLREVEVLCTTIQNSAGPDRTSKQIIEDIQAIMYASNEGETPSKKPHE